jgi:hypothetical protein
MVVNQFLQCKASLKNKEALHGYTCFPNKYKGYGNFNLLEKCLTNGRPKIS